MKKTNNNKNKGRRRPKRTVKSIASFRPMPRTLRIADFTDVRTFSGENLVQVRIKSIPIILALNNGSSTYSGTGLYDLYALTLPIYQSQLARVFQQRRLVAARCEINCLSDYSGTTACGFGYAGTSTAQDFAVAAENRTFRNSIKADNSSGFMWWKVSDYLNAEWVDSGTTPVEASALFFIYTNSTYFGTPTNGTGSNINMFRLEFDLYYEYRGLAGST